MLSLIPGCSFDGELLVLAWLPSSVNPRSLSTSVSKPFVNLLRHRKPLTSACTMEKYEVENAYDFTLLYHLQSLVVCQVKLEFTLVIHT